VAITALPYRFYALAYPDRLLATHFLKKGEPRDREGLKQLKAGKATYDQVVDRRGKPYLRAMTPSRPPAAS
jgi:hypothetical protein